ncbi:cytochrome c biogenesis protein CcsA [Sansalvadorimonas sp. 2012CJ34-2]|uniref:Cytochrome c biogenesis protein CcsA n=1 Tax=Parendozoicomonas callyspongiae TaxID=2942213 RepID=A0ABT0PLZ6_9GAMM|nr:cytochrome c biogenesis protein CcsA [Sansalvadorimonas sp. 2012CJ34-2]MCL6272006.1 cytochrome c biogenesis protein CcsA [Sansalvadorimonas sp. 2012CJ34-2]
MSVEVPSALAITLYSISAILQWLRVKGRDIPRSYVQLLTLGGVTAQCLSVYHAIHIPAGINLNFFSTGSLSAGMVVLIVLASSLRKPVENLFLGLLPLAIAAIATNMLFSASSVILTNHSAGLVAHIIVSILSYSVMTVAAFQALLLSYQERHLKDHLPVGIIKAFPPMQTMEKLLFEFLWAGLILLTFSLGSGFFYLHDMFAQHIAHKTILGVMAWFLFATLLAGRSLLGWRGRTAIRWTLSGFLLLMLAYFGSRFIIDLVIN